jgi:hypothetical protein
MVSYKEAPPPLPLFSDNDPWRDVFPLLPAKGGHGINPYNLFAMDPYNLNPFPPVYSETSEFDYAAAFLQTGEVHFQDTLATHGFSDSSGKTTPPSSDNNRHSSMAGSDLAPRAPEKQRLERRGHTKSRRGCYNCKRRRIKCQENHPACGHCVKTGLKCEYPALPQITHQPHNQIPLFSLQDMRFFQHFLTRCVPRHPLKQEDVWTHEIPCIAHNHEFLMHAILGFAATQLGYSDPSLVAPATNHRIKAIKAIKKRLSESPKTTISGEESNAMVAACFALTFQSVGFEDGMAEFMTFIRGIVVVGMQMMFRGVKPLFGNLIGPEKDELLASVMETLPLIQKGWVDDAVEGLGNLQLLCVEPMEADYRERLMAIAQKLYINSYDGKSIQDPKCSYSHRLAHNRTSIQDE